MPCAGISEKSVLATCAIIIIIVSKMRKCTVKIPKRIPQTNSGRANNNAIVCGEMARKKTDTHTHNAP